jgi:methyl-accepting chemotaxis protein
MRALVWQQAGVPEATIDALGTDITHGLDALRAATSGMAAARHDGDAEMPRLKQVAAQTVAYGKLLADALDLIGDPAIAVGYFRRADATFEALRGDIAGLSTAGRAIEASYVEAARASSHASLIRSYWIFAISGIVMVALLPVVVAAISRPVRALTRVMTALAAGDMDVEAVGQNYRDEIGDMARAVLVFKEHMVRGSALAAAQDEVRRRGEAEKRAALVDMAEKIEAETGSALQNIALRMAATAKAADAMNASAQRTGASAQDATTAADQALSIVQTVASAADQLTSSVHAISRQVQQSTSIASQAVAAGSETRATIEALNKDVEQIGAVAGIIGEIAAVARIEQTISEIDAIAGSIAAGMAQQGAATEAIARNVTETAKAATEMTTRTAEVSVEADETGRQAADVRDNASGLHTAMEELRHSVVRVVRTATADVDRRLNERFTVDLGCRVTVDGQRHAARVVDWSDTGARLGDAPVMRVGSRGSVDIDGVGFPLAFTVRVCEAGSLHVAFVLSDADAVRFGGTPARLAARTAA